MLISYRILPLICVELAGLRSGCQKHSSIHELSTTVDIVDKIKQPITITVSYSFLAILHVTALDRIEPKK